MTSFLCIKIKTFAGLISELKYKIIGSLNSDLNLSNLLKAHYMADSPEVVQSYLDNISKIEYPLIFAHTNVSQSYWQMFLTLLYSGYAVQMCFSLGVKSIKIRTKTDAGITDWENL